MKPANIRIKTLYIIASLSLASLMISSCKHKMPAIPKSDLLTLPSLSAKDFRTTLTDSGRVNLIMSSPLLEQYDKAEPPYAEFRFGINVDLYNGKDKPQANVKARYAKCTNNNLWELRDSVVVINEENEKLETELLFWNQEKNQIYTDKFVKITSEDEIIKGIGFESDTHLLNRHISNITADISIDDEK
jgi:LPS export ABC transporter protein LptC